MEDDRTGINKLTIEENSEKKQSSQQGTKKIAIATMRRLIRTIYHLVITNQTYDYLKTKSSRLA